MRHSHLQRKTTLSQGRERAACRRALGRPVSRNADTFAYNNRSEVVFSRRAAENAEDSYAYDTIGNLLLSASGAETNAYTANELNQYTAISNLCGSAPLRFFQYDADGNLTDDGAFHYAYDAENRLRAVTSARQTNGAVRVLSAYDHQYRRVRKTVQRLSLPPAAPPMPPPPGEWTTTETHTYVWDGNNIALETIAYANGTVRACEYFWGPDLSGTEQDAGGVGGLLAVSMDGVFHIPCYDHNGNIVRYISENGAIAAAYEYDPFGNVLSATGPLADVFTFGFSTKPLDRETGLVAYQRRFDNPSIGRFLNRDPIEEEGGENLYAFCENDPMHSFDSLGLDRYITMFDVAGINNLIFEEGRTQGKPFRTNIHVGIAVDVWRKEKDNPKSKCWHWKRTGIVSFDFSPDYGSIKGYMAFLLVVPAKGNIDIRPGLQPKDPVVVKSEPEEDAVMYQILINEAKNPLSYNIFWRNCIEWSLKAIQYGIGTRPDEGPNDHPRVRY